MERIRHIITVQSRDEPVIVYLLSDAHVGHAACQEQKLRENVRAIAERGAYWIALGDMLDAIGREDKRAREGLLASWLHGKTRLWQEQRKYLADILKPIAGRCLAYLKGNHEEVVEQHGIDMYYSAAEMAGIAPENLPGMSCFLRLTIRRSCGGARNVDFYLHHGWAGGRLLGGHALELERLPGQYVADIYAIGHGHRHLLTRMLLECYNGYRHVILMELPGYLSKYVGGETTYAERRGFRSVPLGAVVLRLYADTSRTIEVEA